MPFFRFIAFGLITVTFVFGLKPFNFLSRNDVRIESTENALVFNESAQRGQSNKRGLAFTEKPLRFNLAPDLSLLLEIDSQGIPIGLGNILTLLDDQRQPPLIIAQWQDHLALRSRRIDLSPQKQYKEIGVQNVFQTQGYVSVLISSSDRGTEVYVNNALVRRQSGYTLKDPNGPFGGRLVLGNNASAGQPWPGAIRRVALFGKALAPGETQKAKAFLIANYERFVETDWGIQADRSFGPALRVPEWYRPAKRDLLSPIDQSVLEKPEIRRDIAINIVGFLPFGFAIAVLSAPVGKRLFPNTLLIALATVFLSSLAIEWLQSYLPSRDSSQLDLLCNTVGGAFAAIAALPFFRARVR